MQVSADIETSGKVSQNLRAQAAVLLPAPYLEEGGFFDTPQRIRISAEEFQLCLYLSMVPPALTLLYMEYG